MRQIVRSIVSTLLPPLLAAAQVAALSGPAAAESDADRAFRERRNEILRSQDPERVRIDRPQSPAMPKIEGIGEGGDLENAGKPTNATMSVSVSEIAAASSASKKSEPGILDFWLEGRYQPYTSDVAGTPMDGNMSVMYAGTKYMVGPDIMLGALAQFDATQEYAVNNQGSLTGSGVMAGPYTSIRFGPGVFFDGRMAWGTGETNSGYLTEGEKSERRLVRGTLRGSRQVEGWTVTPSIGMSYIEDRLANQNSTETEGTTAAGQGRLEVMPEIKRRFSVNETTFVEPRAAAGGFVAFDDLSKLHALPYGQVPDVQMKAEAGVAMGVKDGMNVEAKGGVETSATPDTRDTWSGRFQLNVPLSK